MKIHKKIRKEFLALAALLLNGCAPATSGYVANPDGNNNGATLYCSSPDGGIYTGPSPSAGAQGKSFYWHFNASGGVSVMTSPAGTNPSLSTYSIISGTVDGSVGEFPNKSSLSVQPSNAFDDVVIPQPTRDQVEDDYIRYERQCANKFG